MSTLFRYTTIAGTPTCRATLPPPLLCHVVRRGRPPPPPPPTGRPRARARATSPVAPRPPPLLPWGRPPAARLPLSPVPPLGGGGGGVGVGGALGRVGD